MQASEETIKQHIAALKENTTLLKRLIISTERKQASNWVGIGDLKRFTIWNNKHAYDRARKANHIHFRYKEVEGVITTEYDLSSVSEFFLLKNQHGTIL